MQTEQKLRNAVATHKFMQKPQVQNQHARELLAHQAQQLP